VACETLSNFFQDYHGARGVAFELNAGVEGFDGQDGHVTGVRLADGRTVACDVALVGVGAIPNEELARDAGLECANGVVVDIEARTADPFVFAIGDLTHRPLPIYGRQFRLESVPNALEQAKQAAAAIAGRPMPPHEIPWFWSDQYDLKLQIAGLPFDADRQVVRGDVAAAKFAVFHLKGDLVQAVEAVNAPPEFMAGKQLIAKRTPVSIEKLADPTISMKEVAA
jgi:3-phenylpropionate/trans-cinnamate dioxygenase ferredoxin reductase subunit